MDRGSAAPHAEQFSRMRVARKKVVSSGELLKICRNSDLRDGPGVRQTCSRMGNRMLQQAALRGMGGEGQGGRRRTGAGGT